MPGKVHRTAMSSIATTHMLIAAGSTDVQVRLCDIASGAFTHTLSGHRGEVLLTWNCNIACVLMHSHMSEYISSFALYRRA